ncbi:MAG TPA: HTTM domain-containing protein [Candidatus Binatia bacterium]|jgi:hypothetical protein|nr:HTTM domain-containing protein [Candidatus Binatia bacterium]
MGRKLKEFYFTVPLRSLACYRILLAALLIFDWFARWPDLEAFYTSFGLLPVEAPLPKSGGEFHFCLLDGVASLPMVQAVFCIGLLFYILFLLGYRTRMFRLLSFVFFTSVLSRNVLIRDGSVVVLATMLMWSLFLPMGKRFSLDALLARMRQGGAATAEPLSSSEVRSEPSLAAFAIVAQVGLIYLFTAMAKSGQTWKDGTALYYALNWRQIARPLGQWLASQPLPLIKALTWGVLAMEFAALPLMLAPFAQPWLRRCAIVALAGIHLGIALTTTLGFFSGVMVASYALLLLPEDWELLKKAPGLRRISGAVASFLTRFEAKFQPAPAGRTAGFPTPWAVLAKRAQRWALNSVVAVLFFSFTLDAYNLNMTKRLGQERVPEPHWIRAIVLVPLIQQDWEMFAPDPTRDDSWWVIVGETESGEQLDPLTGRPPIFEKPPDLAFRFDRFWRKYLDRIRLKKNYEYRLYFGKYLTRRNHRDTPEGRRLVRFDFYFVKEPTLPPGAARPWPTERVLLWHHECFRQRPPADDAEQSHR